MSFDADPCIYATRSGIWFQSVAESGPGLYPCQRVRRWSSWELHAGLCVYIFSLLLFSCYSCLSSVLLFCLYFVRVQFLFQFLSLPHIVFSLRREVKREHLSFHLMPSLSHDSNDRRGTGADSAEESGGRKGWFFLSRCITGGAQASACALSVLPIQNVVLAEVG